MILKASQRGGAKAMGLHLLSSDNEHVEVHEIRGFISDNLMGAMKEAQAVAKGTRAKQFLFSVSLNPPQNENVPKEAFEDALSRIEEKLGLTDQPRVVVLHFKEGRAHAHAVWSRIDADSMTAIPMSHFKTKLQEVSRGLYIDHGWQMPRGLTNSKERDSASFTHAEWQQAKRLGQDPKALKTAMQDAWATSTSRDTFAQALERRGLYLARGDARAYVVVTYEGQIFAVARSVGAKAKDVRAKLGELGENDSLAGVEQTKRRIANEIAPKLQRLITIAGEAKTREMRPLVERREAMKSLHANERQTLADKQRERSTIETRDRAARLRTGVQGLWDKLTGRHGAQARQNETEAFRCFTRDRDQRDGLIAAQMADRRTLQREIVAVRTRHRARVADLHRDLSKQRETRQNEGQITNRFNDAVRSKIDQSVNPPARSTGQGRGGMESRGRSSGPSLDR